MSLRPVRIASAPVLLVCALASLPAFADYGDHYAITDPSYSAQWPLENYGQDWPEGCDADPTDPSDDCRALLYDADIDWGAAYDAGYTGRGVIIAIGEPLGAPISGQTLKCDHPDLAGRLWVNPAEDINGSGAYEPLPPPDGDLNGLDDDVPPNGFVDDVHGANFASGDGDVCSWGPGNLFNHDTSTALLAVASQDGYGWVGVAPEAKLMILMGFDDLSAHTVFYDEVIPYAEAAGARVIYVPYTGLGSMLPATPESCAIAGDVVMPNGMTRTEILESTDIVVIWGQPEPSTPDFGNFQYPTCEPAVLGVAQSKEDDTNVMTSIFTDLSVPGARPDRSDVQLSWAMPHAAGALALLFEQDPTLSRAEAIDRLLASADKVGTTPYDASGRNDDYGHGRLNVFDALNLGDIDGDGVPGDGDGSGVVGDFPCTQGMTGCDDNCPLEPNPDQRDRWGGAPDANTPDGIGDACQCGDLGFDGRILPSDIDLVRDHLAGVSVPASMLARCNVAGAWGGGPEKCQADDLAILRRSLAGLGPGRLPICAPALP